MACCLNNACIHFDRRDRWQIHLHMTINRAAQKRKIGSRMCLTNYGQLTICSVLINYSLTFLSNYPWKFYGL